MIYNREAAREQLLKRSQEVYAGALSSRYFKPDSELPLFAPKPTKETPYIIDIIPYIAGSNYPVLDRSKIIKQGDYVYRLEILVHQNIGPRKEWIVCPTANYGKPCPICEEIDIRIANGEEWDDYKDIAPKRRCAYNVIVYDGKNDNRIQIWEVSHKYSEKPIRLQAKSPRTGGIEPFSDPDVGKSISFEVANDEYKTIQGHKLLAREYVIPDEILSQVYILDEEVIVLSYNEIDNIFHFKADEEKEQITKNLEQERLPTESHKRVIVVEENKEKDVPESIITKDRCPHKGVFGESIDKLPECGTCKAYDGCANEADAIMMLKRKAEREAKRASAEASAISAPATTTTETPTGGVRRLRRPV